MSLQELFSNYNRIIHGQFSTEDTAAWEFYVTQYDVTHMTHGQMKFLFL